MNTNFKSLRNSNTTKNKLLLKTVLLVAGLIVVFFVTSVYILFFASDDGNTSPGMPPQQRPHKNLQQESEDAKQKLKAILLQDRNDVKEKNKQNDDLVAKNEIIETVPPLSSRKQQVDNKNDTIKKVEKNSENDKNNKDLVAKEEKKNDINKDNNNKEQFETEAPVVQEIPNRKVCALLLDTRRLVKMDSSKNKDQNNNSDDDDGESESPENEAIVETVKTLVQALNLQYEKTFPDNKKLNNNNAKNAPELLLFSPFVDQPSTFPSSIFEKIQPTPTKIRNLQLSPQQLEKILVFDNLAHAHAHQNNNNNQQQPHNGSDSSFFSDGKQNNNNDNQDSAVEKKKEKEEEQKKSTFIEAVERILLAIEAAKIDPDINCQSLAVVNAVFSSNEDTQKRLEKSLYALMMHPASSTSRRQMENPQSFILSPLIISGNADTRTSNIFSFGNDVVELFEGLAWSVPRYYGYPIHYSPANEEAVFASAPSGALAYFTPASFRNVDKIIEEQFASRRYRVGREWIEKARGNYIVENSLLQENRLRQREQQKGNNNNNNLLSSFEDGHKRRNPNGIPDVDIEFFPHHHHKDGEGQQKKEENFQKKRRNQKFETHFLACDAALAELSATAGQRYNTVPLVVRSSVPPLVFHEEAGRASVSARYMIAVAQAASGLTGVHRGPLENLNYNNNNNQQQNNQDASSSSSAPHQLFPQKLPALPVANVIRALPFITSIAGDLWFRFIGQQYLPNLTLFWDPYCGCTGINIEAVNFLVPLERYVRTRAVAARDCFCPGFPLADQFALHRMQNAKLLSRGTTSKFHVWVSHKPVDAFPSFPYDGSIKYSAAELASGTSRPGDRPDLVIGRTMIEADRIPPDWVARLNDRSSPSRVDELWVPSVYQLKAFRMSGVRADLPIVVIPEAIDTYFYDPQFVTAHESMDRALIGCPGDADSCFVFLSNFKWEHRKGWDILLRAYLSAFSDADNVVLVLKTYLYGETNPRSAEKIRNKIFTWIRTAMPGVNMKRLPKIWIVPEEIPASQMPRLYRGAHCFVMPSRGEGWGLPFQEAMSMGLVAIGPNFGGSLDFMPLRNHGKTHFLINISGHEVVVDPATGGYSRDATPQEFADPARTQPGMYARPDESDLAGLMRHVFDGMTPEERARMGKAARASIALKFGRPPVTEVVLKRLMYLYQSRHNSNNGTTQQG